MTHPERVTGCSIDTVVGPYRRISWPRYKIRTNNTPHRRPSSPLVTVREWRVVLTSRPCSKFPMVDCDEPIMSTDLSRSYKTSRYIFHLLAWIETSRELAFQQSLANTTEDPWCSVIVSTVLRKSHNQVVSWNVKQNRSKRLQYATTTFFSCHFEL